MRKFENITTIVLCLSFLQLAVFGKSLSSSHKPKGSILVVGATGSTGFRAIQGLLDVGYQPKQISLLTRNAQSSKSQALKKEGFGIVQADLEDPQSLQGLVKADCIGCYVHSTSSDTPELDKLEVERAKNLAFVIGNDKNNKMRHIVYNSAAAHEGHGVGRIQQKHDVEGVFQNLVKELNNANQKEGGRTLAFTSLRANIFMEELWKHYTRPQILKGTYPLPVSSKRKIYLTSVRDMGRLAGTLISDSSKSDEHIQTIHVAGDYLSAGDIAKAFANAQRSPCHHKNPWRMTLKSYFYFPELYEQIRFLQTFKVVTNVDELRTQFPDVMTNFERFLKETHWGDRERTYADFSDISLGLQSRRSPLFRPSLVRPEKTSANGIVDAKVDTAVTTWRIDQTNASSEVLSEQA